MKSEVLIEKVHHVISTWTSKRGIVVQLSSDEVNALVADVDRHWSMNQQEPFLKRLDESYASFRTVKSPAKKKGKVEQEA